MSNDIVQGVEIDLDAMNEPYRWYNDKLTVGGRTYPRFIAYLVAYCLEVAAKVGVVAGDASAAATSATSAAGSASAAATSATAAAGSATAAGSARTGAEAARDAAQAAAGSAASTAAAAVAAAVAGDRTAAETARDQAQTAAAQAQAVTQTYRFPAVTGSGDAVVLATGSGLASLTAGTTLIWLAGAANTGAVTVAVDGVAAKPLKSGAGAALTAGAIASGQLLEAVYTGAEFRLVGAAAAVSGDSNSYLFSL